MPIQITIVSISKKGECKIIYSSAAQTHIYAAFIIVMHDIQTYNKNNKNNNNDFCDNVSIESSLHNITLPSSFIFSL
jgi:hypothetical protein